MIKSIKLQFIKCRNTLNHLFFNCINFAISKFNYHIESKYHIIHDLYIIQYLIKRLFYYLLQNLNKKLNYWYIFEKTVFENENKLALVYINSPSIKTNFVLDKDNQNLRIPNDANFKIERLTYIQLYNAVLRLSYILSTDYKIKPDDIVGLDMHNKPLFVVFWFALWNIGAKPAFLNYNITNKTSLIHCLKISNISQVFFEQDFNLPDDTISSINSELPDLKLTFLNEDQINLKIYDNSSKVFRLNDELRNKSDKPWSTSALIFTSGTTGLPKAAIMSWRKVCLGTPLYGHIIRITNNSTVFTSMPLYHSTSSMLGVLPTFGHGGCIAITERFSASNFWAQVKITKSTHIQYVGEICRYLINQPVNPNYEKNHTATIAYGNGLRTDIWFQFKQRFNIHAVGEFYAATEAPIATTSFQTGNDGIGACRNYGSLINYILSYQQILVKMDPDTDNELYRDAKTGYCKVTDAEEPGQLLFRISRPKKPYVDFQGYINNEKETNSKFVRDVFHKGDCWIKTGDLLKYDKDGLMYFIDRLGDTFRWKSENVSTNEIEILINNSNLVNNSVVVGLKIPGHEGKAGFATIIPNSNFDLTKLVNYFMDNIPKYAVPVFIKLADEFITTDNHKIIKKSYREQILPKGKNNDEKLYWLNKNRYEELTEESWNDILCSKIRL
ncbi:long-chain fatty acid transporter FAT1 [Ascoidea rubescens DSM 1968]|uniref:Very long-chain fatty acid transport protein n=1 Tax=Ascoidea rubescens DSM 1968 TaxID=1344418 RepID=A0A1D2VFN7_9ASCO|nr:acetyl-CoA synthetase-like protein [Ascoidea rubescens DSM 1968]ODV60445.1 acetyl-CoA synthetase-like protein [Ascoidea rubescens DSM 1968]